MSIPDSILSSWGHHYSGTAPKQAHVSIRDALVKYRGWVQKPEYDIFLQGSYKNDTNLRRDSDVDIVVRLAVTVYTESTPSLLRTWRYCMAIGKSFSIRQAKCASYLYPVIKDVISLEEWSAHYASYETGYKAREMDIITSDLDGSLMMSPAELSSASWLGKLLPIPRHGGGIIMRPEIEISYEDAVAAAISAETKLLSAFNTSFTDLDEAVKDCYTDEVLFSDLARQRWVKLDKKRNSLFKKA